MARIRNLMRVNKTIKRRHTETDAEYDVKELKDEKLIIFTTNGSDDRQEKSNTQTLLFDKKIAHQLYSIFKSEYSFQD
ncbi:hypothetical protein MMB75_07175 [Paenibacillus sp. P2(2022)]|uniref:hypothetical protein n=1 Tax=Paenibacillus TaxID=44249 RepID=UPI001C9D86D4|nr:MULTISPECIES: hypothetical protein [Paenibacillus]MBY7736727.1 hypothetical protein [Paenibacillus polymyxa]MDG0053450.1 hypothetical protein [Paenibacillus sp. P2(2022)]